uniref:Retrovirus-related Pol polyprotein from transposon TNT 1-94 n=1 Tax=Talaromyces marneffei PM1 TaxID=1077442 RepID=A0A093VHM0_TALMA
MEDATFNQDRNNEHTTTQGSTDNDPTLREGSEHAAGLTDGEGSAAALVQEATIGKCRWRSYWRKYWEGVAGAPTRTVDTVLTRCRDKLNPWRTAFLAGTRDRQYKVNDVKFDHSSLRRKLRAAVQLQATMTGDIYDHERLTRQVLGGRRLSPSWSAIFPGSKDSSRCGVSPFRSPIPEGRDRSSYSHDPAGSWTEVPQSEAREKQILDLKCKARLVARGDQEKEDDMRDTYTATLAARSFRTLMSIYARFGLEIKGFDAVNAFVNAKIDEEMTLDSRPFLMNPAASSLWIILFFYVDDIVLAYKKEREAEANEIMARLRKKYNITGGEDLDWFTRTTMCLCHERNYSHRRHC